MQRGNRSIGRAAVGALGAALIGLPAMAAADRPAGWPETPALDSARAVSDHELAGMRGRFTQGNRVIRFGLEMVSHLQSSTGAHLQGGASLDIDLSGNRPSVAFTPSVSYEPAGDNGNGSSGGHPGTTTGSSEPGNATGGGRTVHAETGSAGGSGGTDNGGSGARGVVQQVQVAGDGNSAVNDMRIDVVERIRDSAAADGDTDTTAAIHGTNGSSVRVTAGAEGMAITLDIPGTGTVTQRIASGRGVEQLIALKGNLNRASSIAQLRVQLREEFPDGGGSMRRALDTLRTLR